MHLASCLKYLKKVSSIRDGYIESTIAIGGREDFGLRGPQFRVDFNIQSCDGAA
jgi:hypothetical protein